MRTALASDDLARLRDNVMQDAYPDERGRFGPFGGRYIPETLVPALDHDGRLILESNVIDEYLDDAFPDPPLRPSAPAQRAPTTRTS